MRNLIAALALLIANSAMAAALAILLAGCTQANIKFSDGTEFQFSRFASDADLELAADGSLRYSSSPSAVAQQNTQALLMDMLRLALQPALPAKLLSPEPAR